MKLSHRMPGIELSRGEHNGMLVLRTIVYTALGIGHTCEGWRIIGTTHRRCQSSALLGAPTARAHDLVSTQGRALENNKRGAFKWASVYNASS